MHDHDRVRDIPAERHVGGNGEDEQQHLTSLPGKGEPEDGARHHDLQSKNVPLGGGSALYLGPQRDELGQRSGGVLGRWRLCVDTHRSSRALAMT